jgi:WhiB family redox-sensing transcriptional regulator
MRNRSRGQKRLCCLCRPLQVLTSDLTFTTFPGRMNTEWMTQGNCRKVAWSVFFPRDGLGVPIAQKICATCHVSQTCLEYALENHINHGVWGGCSERERTRIQRRRRTGQAVGVG